MSFCAAMAGCVGSRERGQRAVRRRVFNAVPMAVRFLSLPPDALWASVHDCLDEWSYFWTVNPDGDAKGLQVGVESGNTP